MDASELVSRYPIVWHMAESGTISQIKKYGLLSTTAILDLYEIQGEERATIERHRRLRSAVLETPQLGKMTLRDQKPLNESLLLRCLTGMTVEEWYATLNERVFFWVNRRRLDRLLCARAYRDRSHTILSIRTEALVASHTPSITLARINSGAIHPGSLAARGVGTFLPIRKYPAEDLSRIVELAVNYSVPDIASLMTEVERKKCDG